MRSPPSQAPPSPAAAWQAPPGADDAPAAAAWEETDALVEARAAGPRLRHVRSTMVCSGLVELRARGLFDAYMRVLDPAAAPILLEAVAGAWLPLAVSTAHFVACDAVVPNTVAFEIGGASFRRVQHSALATVAKLATVAGASPWTVLATYGRLWSRIFDGGTVGVTKVGPKEAIIDHKDVPLARLSYFRNALRGANDGGLRLFASTVFVREQTQHTTNTSVRYRAAWA
jgi:hypothetical protein